MSTKLNVAIVSVAICLCLFTVPISGQQETASITGRITDPSGALIVGARVTIKNQASGASFVSVSDSDGFYRAPQLRPAVYTISATASGFSTVVREGVEARVNDRLRVDLTLQVGSVNESVIVTGAPPLLQTEDATVGQVIDNQKIVELPLNGRSWLQLALVSPAAVTYGTYDSYNPQSQVMNLGGNRTNQTEFLIDGADNNSYVISGGAQVHPPVDSLQEFKVQMNNYTADTGRMGGSVVNATIKSGTNAYHGSLYEFLRNRELNARNFFASPNTSNPQFTRNQFGASVGGPFVRNRVFFFVNYEGTRNRQDSILARQVFTDAQKTGNFAPQLGNQIGTDALGSPVRSGQIFDPGSLQTLPSGALVRTPFPNNMIPGSRMSSVSRNLLSLVPGPNSQGVPNFVRTVGSSRNIDTWLGKFDWVRSDKDTISGRLIWTELIQRTAPAFGLPADGVRDGGTGGTLEPNQRAAQASWTHVFRPTDLNELRIAYLRATALTLNLTPDQNLNSKYGVLAFPDAGAPAGGLASLSISGYTGIGSGGTGSQPIVKYEISDSYTAIRGTHTMKFGFRVGEKMFYNQLVCTNCRGNLSFSGVYTNQPGFGASGNAVADFLLGIGASGQWRNRASCYEASRDFEAYAQDRWRVSPKLTLTAGLLYAFNPAPYEIKGMTSNVLFDLATRKAEIVVPVKQPDDIFDAMKNVLFNFMTVRRAPELSRGMVRESYLNFAPRLGLAWQWNRKTVVRAGYGIFYGFPDVVSTTLGLNPPTRVWLNLTANNTNPTLILDRPLVPANPLTRTLVSPVITSRDPNLRPDFIQMYNLSVQRELFSHWLLEVGFMGSRSSGVLITVPINNARPALPNDTSSPQSRRLVTDQLGAFNYMSSQGFANYNAMVVSLEKRFSYGLSVLASFTWSRALGAAPFIQEGINGAAIQDPLNIAREYGPLEFDIVRRFVASYLYQLPFGRGKQFLNQTSRPVDFVVGGWQFNGITTFQGGFPLTPTLSYSLGKGDTNSRPNLIGDPTKTSRQPHDWITSAAFAIPTNAEIAAGNFYGNQGVGVVRSPGMVNFDFSLFKTIDVREGIKLQFRLEFFNATNTPFFGRPGSVGLTFGTSTFGKITTAGDPRVVQFGLKLLF